MAFWCLIGASMVSLVGALFHGVLGHRVYMGNINASSLELVGKSLSLVSWHVFTIFLVVGAATFAYVAFDPTRSDMVLPLIAANAGGALLFVGLGLSGHRRLLSLPGAYLMGSTAILAGIAIA